MKITTVFFALFVTVIGVAGFLADYATKDYVVRTAKSTVVVDDSEGGRKFTPEESLRYIREGRVFLHKKSIRWYHVLFVSMVALDFVFLRMNPLAIIGSMMLLSGMLGNIVSMLIIPGGVPDMVFIHAMLPVKGGFLGALLVPNVADFLIFFGIASVFVFQGVPGFVRTWDRLGKGDESAICKVE